MSLLAAAKSVVARWDTPAWKDVPATATYIAALREAIAEAKKQDPVAWRVRRYDSPYWIMFLHKPVDALLDPEREVQHLYTYPKDWVGLTDEEKDALVKSWFAEGWAMKAATGMLDDYETVMRKKNGGQP